MKINKYQALNSQVGGLLGNEAAILGIYGWNLDEVGDEDVFNLPDLPKLLPPHRPEPFQQPRKGLVSWKDSLGRVKHRLVCLDTGKTIFNDIPQTKDTKTWTMPFGKHRGKTMDQIPDEYKQWAAQNIENKKIKQLFQEVLNK